MKAEQQRPLKVFVSYSHEDEKFRRELEVHLALLKRSGLVSTWSDRVIRPGERWAEEIDSHLEQADIFLCLVSPDFLASDYCYEIEMRRALELQDEGMLIVLPIIVRHSAWHMSPLAALQALPANAFPISSWQDKDEAWLSVSGGIENICRESPRQVGSNRISQRTGRKISVALFGMTGVGKSSLINALTGQEAVRVSDVIAVTRSVQRVSWLIEGSGTEIEMLDCPGLGEDYSSDERYRETYDELLKEVDLAIWVQDSSSRILAEAKRYLRGSLQPFIFGPKSFLLVVNRVDLVPPIEDWNDERNCPGRSQEIYVERRLAHLAGALGLPTGSIIAVSALKGFNMEALKRRITNTRVGA